MHVEILTTDELTAELVSSLHFLWDAAFGDDFTEYDAEHALGGLHAMVRDGNRVFAQASAVPRTLWVDEVPFRTGYVEAVATLPRRQGEGLGSAVMRELQSAMGETFELAVLSTGSARAFYQRLGWEAWQGPSYVLRAGRRIRTQEEDEGLMALRFSRRKEIRLDAEITCEDRLGDCW